MATTTSSRRGAALIAALSAATLVLAACGTSGEDAAASVAPTSAAADVAQAQVATDQGADAAAVETVEAGAGAAADAAADAGAGHDDMAGMDMAGMDHSNPDVSAEVELYRTMRSLWDEHMQWTFDTVVAYATNPDGLEPILNRLLANQVDIGNAVKPFYGDEAGDALTALLTEHITDAVPVLDAAKAGDTKALGAAIDEWNRNAVEIGDFLAGANPAWGQDEMREMMKGHISQTVTYASDVLTGDWAAAVTDYDTAQAHMKDMADMLSAGLIAQFPDKF